MAWTPTRRHEGPLQPGRRDLRRRAATSAPRADKDINQAIFAYNHADWYVQSVILRAKPSAACPPTSRLLTGLTEGHSPSPPAPPYAQILNPRAAR